MTPETFREALRAFALACSHMSLSHMWRKKAEFDLLLTWAHENKPLSVTILIEEIESCGWQALDLIYELIGQEIISESFHYPNKFFPKLLALYRFALDHGYDSEKIRLAEETLRKKLHVEQKMDRVIDHIDRRRRFHKMKSQDWKRARARLLTIALHDPSLFFHHALHDILLWRGFNTSHPDDEIVRFLSEVMTCIAKPPKKLMTVASASEIYLAWFRGDEQLPTNLPSQN